MTKNDLVEIRKQLDRPGAFALLKHFLEERVKAHQNELFTLDPEKTHEQSRLVGKQLESSHLLEHFSHYVDNLINETDE